MTYIPPNRESVHLAFDTGYIPPNRETVNITMSDDPVVFRVTGWLDEIYSLRPVGPIQGWFDEIYYMGPRISFIDETYHVLSYNQAWLDLPYSYLLGAWLSMFYGDSPTIKAYLDEYYKSNPELKKYLDLFYADTRTLIAYLDEAYTIAYQLLAYVDLPYTIAEKIVMAYKDLGYDIKDTNPLISILTELYAISADSVIEESALVVTIDGVRVYPFHVNFEFNIDSYKASAEIQVAHQEEYLLAKPNESVLRIQDGTDDLYFDVEIPTEHDSVGQTYYVIPAESKSRILERAEALNEEFPANMASVTVTEIAARYGITVQWNVLDWFIPEAILYANDETPYTVIQKITSAIGAVLQPTTDGNLRVERNMESNSNAWDVDEPAYYLTDQKNFFSTSESPSDRKGYNIFSISDYGTDDERTWLEQEEITVHKKHIKGYRVPFDDQTLKLFTSDSNATIEANGIKEEQHTEEIEIVNGEGKTAKPIYEVISTHYNDDDLGVAEHYEEGLVTTNINGQSLLVITYKTKYWSWTVIDNDVERSQFWVEIA